MATGSFEPIMFLSRRAKRLLPSLFLLLFLILVYSTLFESWILEQARTQITVLFSLFSFSNWRFAFERQNYFLLSTDSNPLLHTWSLGVEEQYYLLFPIVVLVLVSYVKSKYFLKSAVVSAVVLVFIVSLFFQIRFSLISADDASQLLPTRQVVHNIFHPFYGTVGRVWEFLLGIFGYFVSQKKFQIRTMANTLLSLSGLLVVITATFIADDSIPAWSWANILVCLATTLTLVTTSNSKDQQILGSRPLVWIGDRSYGWYLWHWPLIVGAQRYFGQTITNSLIASIIGLVIASVTYSFYENPIRVKVWSPKKTALYLAIPFALLFALVGLTNKVITPSLIEASGSTYSENVNGCRPNFELCIYPSTSKDEYLLLNGDSHGLSIASPMLRIAQDSGLGLIICTKKCGDANSISDLANEYKIKTLVSMNQFQSASGTLSTSAIQFGRENPSIKVVLVLDNPLFSDWKSPSIFGPHTNSLLVLDVIREQAGARKFLVNASRQYANITIFDTLEHICIELVCPVQDGRKFLYFDDNHLSEFGSMKLYPALKYAVARS